ncbi:(Fe-S)-binding protein [bacterium]|nr:(Fe-S)-binding protein [bacterium]
MKSLIDFKNNIRKCSKCGICQADCPIYKITGNDCSVSRGFFVMLNGYLKGDLKLTKTINRYLELCLKCRACEKSCPAGINVIDIVIAAKSDYMKNHPIEKIKIFILKFLIFGLFPKILNIFRRSTKSKQFNKKVLYFGGCASRVKGDKSIVKLLNAIDIEVINPSFNCCGMPYFIKGDLEGLNNSIKNYINLLKKYDIKEIVVTCASCEKTIKDYVKWADKEDCEFLKKIQVKNIYEYLKDKHFSLKSKKPITVTYHKPCSIDNFQDVERLLKNIDNLKYIEMNDFGSCCGLNGLTNIKEYKIFSNIFKSKRKNIINSQAKIVLTSCAGCQVALNLYSAGQYKTYDLIDFLSRYL